MLADKCTSAPAHTSKEACKTTGPSAAWMDALSRPAIVHPLRVEPRNTSRNKIGRPAIVPPLRLEPRYPPPSHQELVWDLSARTETGVSSMPDGSSSASFLLKMERERPAGIVDHVLHMSVLNELLGPKMCELIRDEMKFKDRLGQEMRELIRDELKMAFEGLPDVLAKAKPILPVDPVIQDLLCKPILANTSSPQPNSSSRLAMTSDPGATSRFLLDLAQEKKMSISAQLATRTRAEYLANRLPRFKDIIFGIDNVLSSIGSENAPDRSDCLSKIVEGSCFRVLVTLATLTNCVFLTYSADWQMKNYSSSTPEIFLHIDYAFLMIFSIELLVRLWRYRWHYFYGMNYLVNWADLFIVIGGVVDIIASQVLHTDLTALRTLRLLRLLKVFRVLRLVSMFKTFRVILHSLMSTFIDLFWCTGMLALIQYMFALVFVMNISVFLRTHRETLPGEQINELTHTFGSVLATMFSLFSVSMGGEEWGGHYKLLSPTGVVNQGIYLFFVIFSFVAVLNVILGIFVEKAMKNLELTKEEMAREHALEEVQVADDLMALCMEADGDGDGYLSLEEWDRMIGRGKLSSYMDLMGFRSHDLRAFFELCATHSETGRVRIETFVRGCMRMRGPASCFDVQTMLVELHALNSPQGRVER